MFRSITSGVLYDIWCCLTKSIHLFGWSVRDTPFSSIHLYTSSSLEELPFCSFWIGIGTGRYGYAGASSASCTGDNRWTAFIHSTIIIIVELNKTVCCFNSLFFVRTGACAIGYYCISGTTSPTPSGYSCPAGSSTSGTGATQLSDWYYSPMFNTCLV
jgi:hypothetical protein